MAGAATAPQALMPVRVRGAGGISAKPYLPRDALLEDVKADIASRVAIPEGRLWFYRCNSETEERIGEKLRESTVTVADAAANGFLYVMDSRPAAPAAGPAAAGGVTLADLIAKQAMLDAELAELKAQHALVAAELLPMLQQGVFTVLDLEGHPICCGFFVSDSGIALTVNHGRERWLHDGDVVHAVMLKAPAAAGSAAAAGGAGDGGAGAGSAASAGSTMLGALLRPDEVPLTFRVHSSSPDTELDYTCMILTSVVPAGTFKPLPIPKAELPFGDIVGQHATLLAGSIAYNRDFMKDPTPSLWHCSIITAQDDKVVYSASTSGGDSGGALILSRGKLVIGMHTEGWNDVSDEVEVLSPSEQGRKAHKRAKLSEHSPSTSATALRLDLPVIRAAIAAAESAAGGAARGGGTV